LMERRDFLETLILIGPARAVVGAGSRSVSTLIDTGSPGYSDSQVANPYGLAIGPDAALYFCDLDNQRIRRLDLKTRRTTTIAGNGARGYEGNGGAAVDASLNMPHEIQFDARGNLYIAERDNHVVRVVEAGGGRISTFAGTGTAGFSGDGGAASAAQLRGPHSIAIQPGGQFRAAPLSHDLGEGPDMLLEASRTSTRSRGVRTRADILPTAAVDPGGAATVR